MPSFRLSSLLLAAALLYMTWLPQTQAATKTAADYYVSSLPGAPEPLLNTYAGHIEITPETNGNMFFWFYKNRHIANRQRTVIWINGGPGCSSMDGAMMEIGPYRVQDDGNLAMNNGSWDEFANVLFVDNPVGTGFSYVNGDSYVRELDDMADQFVTFLEKWFKIFPEYADDDLYMAGESYAGQHIPYIARAILDRNAKQSTGSQWNLTGLLIGNGWISGPEQYLSYIPFAYETGLMASGSEVDTHARADEKKCIEKLDAGGNDKVDIGQCESIMWNMIQELKGNDKECINMYDVRLKGPSCGVQWPPDLPRVTEYLRREDVVKALHINADKHTGWEECNHQVGNAFKARNSEPSQRLLPKLLEAMPIALFSGDKDMICNHLGTEDLIKNLEWNGAVGMETSKGMTAPKRDWTFEGEPAGTWQSARNLTYIRFYNSSHMVPFDYPRRTRDMLDRFMGVDIDSIGGEPADSRIDGEKGPDTSVGGHPNSTAAAEAENDKVSAAKWAAYRRSGEVALVIVLIATGIWAYFIWRERRRRKGYFGVRGNDPYDSGSAPPSGGLGLDASFRDKRSRENQDIEAAADFDEAELDELTADGTHKRDLKRDRFGLTDDDSEDENGRR